MPPAFNLSQDQTLQFNLCKLSSKLTWKNQFHVSIRVFLFAKHHIAYATQRRPPTPNAHTYRLLIFKEQAFNELCILAQSLHILQETLKKARTLYGLFFRLYVSYRLRLYVSFCLLGLLQPIRILCELFVSCCMSPVSSLFVSCYTSPASSFLDLEALL